MRVVRGGSYKYIEEVKTKLKPLHFALLGTQQSGFQSDTFLCCVY